MAHTPRRTRKSAAAATPKGAARAPAPGAGLERAIGLVVRAFRHELGLTVAAAAKAAGLSPGMLSKIENGQTSPSLATLQALSAALNVPVTAFFRRFEESREASHVRSGQGMVIERRGSRAGHRYQLLGHGSSRTLSVEPMLVTLTAESDVFPLFQHAGTEFLYMLEGDMEYVHGGTTYRMRSGDSLMFDGEAAHGPLRLIRLPIRFLSLIVAARP
ncbi:MAG: helix-turn-helix domain-containing protein [Alphaproteobacteria bacterium]|nr:helix-turn-helix domain-containing protein [Alphaproteobacteria bacterium]